MHSSGAAGQLAMYILDGLEREGMLAAGLSVEMCACIAYTLWTAAHAVQWCWLIPGVGKNVLKYACRRSMHAIK
jgi:hypothetical protein